MTHYLTSKPSQSSISAAAREAKAKRRAVVERVRAQRVKAHKRTVAEWIQAGAIIRGSDLKEQYERKV
jgi:hypothetical protein